eukprot:1158308-Pelagomonas_calceolata.AAC.10
MTNVTDNAGVCPAARPRSCRRCWQQLPPHNGCLRCGCGWVGVGGWVDGFVWLKQTGLIPPTLGLRPAGVEISNLGEEVVAV